MNDDELLKKLKETNWGQTNEWNHVFQSQREFYHFVYNSEKYDSDGGVYLYKLKFNYEFLVKKEEHTSFHIESCYFSKSLRIEDCRFNGQLIITNSTANQIQFKDLNGHHSIEISNSIVLNEFKVINHDIKYMNFTNLNVKKDFILVQSDLKVVSIAHSKLESNLYLELGSIDLFSLFGTEIKNKIFINELKIREGNRETFQLLKDYYLKINDNVNSAYFRRLEMIAYEKSLLRKFKENRKQYKFETIQIVDLVILVLNKLSNNHGCDPFRGVLFTTLITTFFYIIFLFTVYNETGTTVDFSFKYLSQNIKQVLQLLNVTNWDYKPFSIEYTWGYVPLFFSRIFIGYGIYQTIAAFRKFGKL